MNILLQYKISCLLTTIFTILIGSFVFSRNVKSKTNKIFLYFSLSIALWSIFLFFNLGAQAKDTAVLFVKLLHIFSLLIPVFFLHITLILTRQITKRLKILYPAYTFSFFLITLIAFLPRELYLTAEYREHFGFFVCVPGPFYPVHLIFAIGVIILAWALSLKPFFLSEGIEKQRLKYFLISTLIGWSGGLTNYFINYNIRIFPFYPFGNYTILAYIAVLAYTILRYQLMDIEVIIKKTLVFAGLFTFAYGVIVGIAMITQELLPQLLAVNRLVSLAISAVVIVFSLRPLENFLVNATNKYLFQKKYDPRKILKEFADEALTILNLDKLCRVTIDTLVKHLYLKNCAILLLIIEDLGYGIYDSFGIENKGIYFNTESTLVKSLKNSQLPLLYQSYDKSLQATDNTKKDMDKIQSQLCIPLVIRNELVGILSLGAKKSDQPYNADDIDILITLTKTLSIAISNARLFMQAAQNEKLATIGTITSAIDHEVCGPLGNISVNMQLFMSDIGRGMYKNYNELLKKVKDIIQDTRERIRQATNITNKLSNFAKPSNVVESEPIGIAQGVEDALILLKHKLELNKIKVEKNIPENLPKIVVDENQIQQIFFNLIRNAAEAIKEKGTITIIAKEDNNKVKIQIQDTGCGIPEDKLDEIFKPFYTTKGEIKGSGYGLAIVKELVQRNNGNIAVKSKVGKGTIFYLEFLKA